MKIKIDVLEKYLFERYGNWANEQGLFLKLVEEIGEVAEIINMRCGSKKAKDIDLQISSDGYLTISGERKTTKEY